MGTEAHEPIRQWGAEECGNGPLLICPNEGLSSLGSFPGLFVRVGLPKLVREDPRVRVRGTAVWAKSRGSGAQTGLPHS